MGMVAVMAVAVLHCVGRIVNLGEIQNSNTDAMGRAMPTGFGLVFPHR